MHKLFDHLASASWCTKKLAICGSTASVPARNITDIVFLMWSNVWSAPYALRECSYTASTCIQAWVWRQRTHYRQGIHGGLRIKLTPFLDRETQDAQSFFSLNSDVSNHQYITVCVKVWRSSSWCRSSERTENFWELIWKESQTRTAHKGERYRLGFLRQFLKTLLKILHSSATLSILSMYTKHLTA